MSADEAAGEPEPVLAEGDADAVAGSTHGSVAGSARSKGSARSGASRRSGASKRSGGSRRSGSSRRSGGTAKSAEAGQAEDEEEGKPKAKREAGPSFARRDLISNSKASSRTAREAAKLSRFRTTWSDTLRGAAVSIDGGGLRAVQSGKYPATDGTSVWAAEPLPETGAHYWETVFTRPGVAHGEGLRGGFMAGVAKSTRSELNEDDELEELPRDCAREQYLFRLDACWGMEDSPCVAGGPLRANGAAHGGSANALGSPTWPLPPRLRNAHDRAYGCGERVGCMVDMDRRTLQLYREASDGQGMVRLDGCVVDNIGVLPHPVTGEPVRHKIHIAATAASEGATATLSFPVEPVLQRLDELDDARLAAAQAKLEEARRNSGQPLTAGINPFD